MHEAGSIASEFQPRRCGVRPSTSLNRIRPTSVVLHAARRSVAWRVSSASHKALGSAERPFATLPYPCLNARPRSSSPLKVDYIVSYDGVIVQTAAMLLAVCALPAWWAARVCRHAWAAHSMTLQCTIHEALQHCTLISSCAVRECLFSVCDDVSTEHLTPCKCDLHVRERLQQACCAKGAGAM